MSSSKQEVGGKLLSSRILSRERSSVANASFRVYYSLGAGTVPFVWESKPGTPKSTVVPAAGADALPPISPPPSYQSSSQSKAKKRRRRPSSYSWPSGGGGWMSWFNIRRRSSPSPSPSTDRGRWLGTDRGADDDRRPRRAILCF